MKKKKLKFVNVSCNLFNELILFVLDNENLKVYKIKLYNTCAQKMVCKIFNKFINLPLNILEKLKICDCFIYYKELLLTKGINDECKFLIYNLF